MTEQIRESIQELKIADEYCVVPSIKSRKLAILSLQAWEEVLNELERECALSELLSTKAFYRSVIGIINQHLLGIKE